MVAEVEGGPTKANNTILFLARSDVVREQRFYE